MKTIKVLKSKVNDSVTTYIENSTVYNEDYWYLILLEVEDDFDIESDDFSEYKEQIQKL